ncbi:ATP-binding protein [Aerosakkonemataceae cyanobacterium BLCC-F154]|uniref:histidine kinase n=1 Tax=Floridaenema fluviatile BLCC-F154 TaxID=3153640 RepID=A0ABV4YA42_9CYAN
MKNRKSKILAVDDAADNLFMIQTILSEEGYYVSTSSNGLDAIASIEASPPDLILLDVMMPNVDGYEVTFRIRSNTQLPFIPILLVTADESTNIADGLDLGADDFVYKPIEVQELLARVRSLLRLKHTIDAMQEMTKAKEDFVSRLTHDLRTPLVAAERMLSLLHRGKFGELPPQAVEAITTVSDSNENLLALVNTLLEVHRFEAGCKRLTIAPFNLNKMIREVVKELELMAVEKNLSLIYEDTTPIKIRGDCIELRRVITNLVGNAIKFTDVGHVKIAVRQDAESVSISVEDTGPGIRFSEQTMLFERFRTGNHAGAGCGLGLHLSRRIVEAHKGSIQVISAVGKGSVFTVRFPTSI